MTKIFIKTAIAAVCIVATGMGGMKAYNAANQSESNMLLSENVEALSAGDGGIWCGCITEKNWGCVCGVSFYPARPFY